MYIYIYIKAATGMRYKNIDIDNYNSKYVYVSIKHHKVSASLE